MKEIKIGNRKIGENEKTFIIAEAGVNHNKNVELAKKLVDVAYEAGADAVKFQVFKAEKLVVKRTPKADYQKLRDKSKDQYEMLKRLELSEEEIKEISIYARKRGILFLATPFDFESADFLEELGVKAFKIASSDLTNIPLIEHIAEKGKPIILSTGMSTICEIEEAVHSAKAVGNDQIVLLHCVTSYPAKFESLNLRSIITLKNVFGLPVGFSDHSLGIYAPLVAVSLGATIIEKHFTLDKNLPGPDHKASLEPSELKEMIHAIRLVESMLGDGVKRPTEEEEKIKMLVRRSIVAKENIKAGQIIGIEKLDFKRPAYGIEPKFYREIIGKKAKRDIKKGEFIKWSDLE